ncbi:uncharacterized protein LOC126895054 isoform X2 [Daktulosphaira vitifoliae]|uniref:uncharacterized protein LOC126895054 isoform X2 n=1 Tax=Daktulosphaira vitifoliae TaxID=58002 RepID=UPI0021AAA920|nr:uncharacterized protein LOC126895054 isoform X2 [Daktulosphaira vitifoliae]
MKTLYNNRKEVLKKMAEGLRLSILLVLFVFNWAKSENTKCVNVPMKQIICQFGTSKEITELNPCLCTHIAVPVSLELEKNDDTKDISKTIKFYKESNINLKLLAAVTLYAEDVAKKPNQICKEIIDILVNYDGVQLDLKQSDISVDKTLIVHFFKELTSKMESHYRTITNKNNAEVVIKSKEIQLVLPPNSVLLSKQYDLKKLSKIVDYFIIATHNLVDTTEQKFTYHPSRLMGSDDLLNADALVDLILSLGVHHSSLLLSLPSTANKFVLKDPFLNTPRSSTVGLPTIITRQQMCEEMREGNWTIERDEDFTAPYAFMNTTWMAFDDSVSASIKGKYVLLRDLAGIVVTDVEALDWKSSCSNQTKAEPLTELAKTFTETARKSRAAQFLSLQEQLQNPVDQEFYFNNEISYSPYYIERVVSRDGEVHIIRKDVKTEFECSRQGYFRHPSGCNRFYRCVKFDQQSNYFTVYEYDCPDGLAFDEKVEVCVWPGSLSDSGACQGSSEIAPVPRNQFICPSIEGYYADPENCRWFFACLDHAKDGNTPLTAYEFKCPFGLVFDEQSLNCDWPWKVEKCGNSAYSQNLGYGEQSYQPYPQQFSGLQSINSFLQYNQNLINQQKLSYGSVDTHISSYEPKSLYAKNEPQNPFNTKTLSYTQSSDKLTGSTPNISPFFYSSTKIDQSSTPSPQLVHNIAKNYVTLNNLKSGFISTQNYESPNQSPTPFNFIETYTDRPSKYASSIRQYSSSTLSPTFTYVSSDEYNPTQKSILPYSTPDTYAVPNQPTFRINDYNSEFSRTPVPGTLYHQSHNLKSTQYDSTKAPGVLLHQQNNFQSIPVNQNYDSHKSDIQYPPLRDYELYSTTQKPEIKIQESGYYTTSIPKIYPSSTILNEPHFNTEIRKDNNLDKNYEYILSSNDFYKYSKNQKQYFSTSAPYVPSSSSIGLNLYEILSTTPNPLSYEEKLYQTPVKSSFNFEDYLSNVPSQSYQTAPIIKNKHLPSLREQVYSQTTPNYSTTSKPSIRYYSLPQTSETYNLILPYVHSSSKIETITQNSPSYSSPSYSTTTARPIKFDITDYKFKNLETNDYSNYSPLNYIPSSTPNTYTSTAKPTVNYYTPSSISSTVDDAYISDLISKLSHDSSYSSTVKTLYQNKDYEPNYSFNIDEYIAKLSENIEHSTLRPEYSSGTYKPEVHSNSYISQLLPTSTYFSSTEKPIEFNEQTYSILPIQSTTCKPGAAIKVSAPKFQYVPSLESVFSVKPITYTQQSESLGGFSSTAANLIDNYHNIHNSLDSAYRAPYPKYYSPPVGNTRYTTNYSLPREYEKDAGHVLHTGYPLFPLQPIIVEPVSAELNAEFEKYYMAGIKKHLKSEKDGKVFAEGDSNSLLVGKLGAQCDCTKKNKPIIVTSTTKTVIDNENDDDEKIVSVKAVETKSTVVLEELKKSSKNKLCTRPGLFRDPKQCNKFYSCNWDKWSQKYEISEFKCPIHLAFDENISACNWPSKGPTCSHDTLITYTT